MEQQDFDFSKCLSFEDKKANLLLSLQGHRSKYKRLALSPIRYAGGKSLAVGYVIEELPQVKRIISPFFGGGSVEIAIAQKLGIEVIGSDINIDLANYWHHQINEPAVLYEGLNNLEPTKKEYNRVKEICKLHRKGQLELSKLDQAVYFFFNHNLSYGPSYIGWASNVYLNEGKYQKMLEKVRDFDATIQVTCETFEVMFQKYPNDFFYCDPPYFLKQDDSTSQMFAGIYPERNNPFHHKNFDHEKLRDLLNQHQGGFIVSYNDCSKSREYYKDYTLKYPSWQYTMGQGETRISKILGNRDIENNHSHIKKSHEVLILSSLEALR